MTEDGSTINILIVEDELLIAYAIKGMLEPKYMVCGIAKNYREAMDNLASHKVDIVLLDVALAGEKSGIDIARHLNVIGIPFIFITALTHEEGLQKLLTHNPAAYLSKPIHQADLFSAIHLALKNYATKPDKFLEFYVGKKRFRFSLNKVIYVQAEHIYCKVVLIDDEILLRVSLRQVVDQSHNKLRRVNRKVAINPNHIKVEKAKEIILSNEVVIALSKSYY